MTGLEQMLAIGSGELPGAPIAELLGFEPVDIEEERVTFVGRPGRQHLGGSAPYGRVAAYPRLTGASTAATPRPCSTRRWAAPSTRRSRRELGTRRSS
jgi:hypothetical protein